MSYNGSGGSRLEPIEVDAVIPRLAKNLEAGIFALSALALGLGIPSTAHPEALSRAKNKPLAQLYLDSAGIPTPYSVIPNYKAPPRSDAMFRLIEPDIDKPVVVKKNTGSGGDGVGLAPARRYAKTILNGFGPRAHIQEFVENPTDPHKSTDIRLIVVEGQVVASMKRQARGSEVRANVKLGAVGCEYEPTPREHELAIRAAEAIGLEIAGVDIMPSVRGPLVIEVNGNPGLRIEKYTGQNVVKYMAALAVKKAKANIPGVLLEEAQAAAPEVPILIIS